MLSWHSRYAHSVALNIYRGGHEEAARALQVRHNKHISYRNRNNNDNCLAVSIWFRKRVFDAMPEHTGRGKCQRERERDNTRQLQYLTSPPRLLLNILSLPSFSHINIFLQLDSCAIII
jgi:hypothetical protein